MMDECDLNNWMELQQTNLMDHREETKRIGVRF
jgi:hypothetical protein